MKVGILRETLSDDILLVNELPAILASKEVKIDEAKFILGLVKK